MPGVVVHSRAESQSSYSSVFIPMLVFTKTTLVGMVDEFKMEQKDRDSGQVVMKSLWKGFVAKRSREMGHCLSVCLSRGE